MKETLIINYCGLRVGGIENYFSRVMLRALEKGWRVIWLTTYSQEKAAFYRDVADNPRVEKVYIKRGWRWQKYTPFSLAEDEHVYMISFELLDYMRAEDFRRKFRTASFYHFYVLAHFENKPYFPDKYFENRHRKRWYHVVRKLVDELNERGAIRAFAMKHLDTYENYYHINISEKENKILAIQTPMREFDDKEVMRRASSRSKGFTIAACSRFEFPHKAFLLGLVDRYGVLKERCPDLRLVIIGDGEGSVALRERIDALPEQAREDIILTGNLSYDELCAAFGKCHLNVGVAGALVTGAECGLPSLVVRHYSDTCETYGNLGDCGDNTLRDEPGEEILPYIEKFMQMSDEDYCDAARMDYYAAAKKKNNVNPDYIFEQTMASSDPIGSGLDVMKWRLLNLERYIKIKFFHGEP